jgi:hypothetical protein
MAEDLKAIARRTLEEILPNGDVDGFSLDPPIGGWWGCWLVVGLGWGPRGGSVAVLGRAGAGWSGLVGCRRVVVVGGRAGPLRAVR